MIKKDLESAGIVLNREKSIWMPSQKGKFWGFNIDTTKMEFSVPTEKIVKLLSLLKVALNSKKCDANFIARIAGRIISMGPALGPISRLMTRGLYTFIQSRSSWFKEEILGEETITELKFWESNIRKASGFRIKGSAITTKVIFSDASDHGYGGFVMTRLGNQIAKGSFDKAECIESSTYRELIAVKYILQSFGNLVADEKILWYTDNMNTARIIEVGSKKPKLTTIALDIFSISVAKNIEIHPIWIPREQNCEADKISKDLDSDSWGIDGETFNFIEENFGNFTYDRFADEFNRRTKLFSARYFCPGADGINAFTSDWSNHFNWLCPPISLIGTVLKHMYRCKADGVLLVPEWHASKFWPFLVDDQGKNFNNFVKRILVLDPFFIAFNKKAANIFSGHKKFRTFALLISFHE